MRWVVFLFFGLTACGTGKQAYQKSVNERLNQFFNASQQQDYMAMTEMLYYKLYHETSREQMLAAFEQLKQDMEYTMQGMEVKYMGQMIQYQDTQYVPVSYQYTMAMRFADSVYHDPQLEAQLLQTFRQQYDEVALDTNHTFTMPIQAHLVAIAPKPFNAWTFLEIKDRQKGQWLQVLPAPVIDQLKVSAALQSEVP